MWKHELEHSTVRALRFSALPLLVSMISPLLASQAGGSPRVVLPILEEAPTIDGDLGDPGWDKAALIDDFGQVEPNSGAEPTERTEVRVARTPEALYIGAICFDRDPEAILARDRRRDSTGSGDDRFRIVIDPFGRGRDGYFFGIAAGGSKGDGILRAGNIPAMEWDCIWNARTRVDENGWTVEVEIPFRSFGFDPDLSTWGFNLERVIRRREEVVRWASATRERSLYALEGTGEIGGMTELKTGLGLDVRPTLVTRWTDIDDVVGSDFDLEPSLDAFFRLTPSLTATLTWQTDFAETEVDARRVNTSRFPLFFPEKRAFFLEDAKYFRFGGIRRSPLPFHSRTIGLAGNGQRVPISGGGKLTGKVGDWNLGLLGVGLEGTGDLVRDQAYAGRVSYDFLEESQIGGILTHGDPRGNGEATTYGLDMQLKNSALFGEGSKKTGELIGWAMGTDNDGTEDYGWGLTAIYPNSPFWARAGIQRIGEDLNPAMGFVRRPGIYEFVSFLSYKVFPENDTWDEIDFDLGVSIDTDLDWRPLSQEYEFDSTLSLEGGGGFNFGFLHERDKYLSDFEISDGVIVPVGDYEYTRGFGGFRTPSTWKWQFGANVSGGQYLGGTRTGLDAQVIWKPNPAWAARVSTLGSWYDLPGGEFETVVVNGAVQWTPTTNVLVTTDIQFDNVSDDLGVNARLRWIVKPGSDVYLVLNQSLSRVGEERRFQTVGQEAVAKVGWTFRF